jgi:hypothetical protein
MNSRTTELVLDITKCFAVSTIFLGSVVLAERAVAQDNPATKDGNPCIEEICINDEVKNLPQLNWEKVNIRTKTLGFSFAVVGDPGAVKVFSSYLNVGSVDGTGLRALAKIQGFCQSPLGGGLTDSRILSGKYLNKKGQSVAVDFAFVPSEDGKSQKFLVTKIYKQIAKGTFTDEQILDLQSQAQVKYTKYFQESNGSPRYPNVSVFKRGGDSIVVAITSQFGQLNPPDGIPIDVSKFQYFPGCGADKKLKL